jgi:hypothetical protein
MEGLKENTKTQFLSSHKLWRLNLDFVVSRMCETDISTAQSTTCFICGVFERFYGFCQQSTLQQSLLKKKVFPNLDPTGSMLLISNSIPSNVTCLVTSSLN